MHRTRHIGPNSRPSILAKLDGRTKESRLLAELRIELTAHAGGEPSATQRALIEQAVQIKLRLAVMDRKFAETGAQTEHDGRQYLAWANSLARLLRQLGMQGTEPRPPSIAEYFAAKAAATPTSGPPEAHNASPQKSAAAPILVPATGRGEAV